MNQSILIRYFIAAFVINISLWVMIRFSIDELVSDKRILSAFFMITIWSIFFLPIKRLDVYKNQTIPYWTFNLFMTLGMILITIICFSVLIVVFPWKYLNSKKIYRTASSESIRKSIIRHGWISRLQS